jgi:DNA polymerase-1
MIEKEPLSKQKEKDTERGIKTLVLFDAHAIIHRAYHALPDFSSSKGEPTGAIYGLSAMLIKIIADLKPDYMAACYDRPEPTYRHEAYEGYKATREKIDDDLVAQLVRSEDIFKAFSIPVYSKPGFEADDVIGTIVEKMKKEKDMRTIIASGDMDTLQLVQDDKTLVYTLKKGISDTILYDEEKVIERYSFPPALLADYKGLRGDPSDNIIGIKGIGEKTATTLITSFGSIESIYKTLEKNPEKLEEVGIKKRIIELLKENREEAEFSKMLATIHCDVPIIFELSGKVWKEEVDIKTVEKIFDELEFRTLGTRFKDMLHQKLVTTEDRGEISQETKQTSLNQAANEPIDDGLLKETAIAIWLLDSNQTDPSLDDILRFAKTRDFKKAREIILEGLKRNHLLTVFEKIEKPIIPIIDRMEKKGIKIDRQFLSKLSEDYHKTLEDLEKKISLLAGEEFNINSPKQLGKILFEKLGLRTKSARKTPTGARSTRESVLEEMKDAHPIIPLILEYREFQKLLSTYIDNIPAMLDADSRLHTSLLQTGTTTGRMSSNNPNLQNIPIKTEVGRNIRAAFITERGYKLASLDYSQIELRIAAFLSGDKKLIKVFKDGEDVHSAVAAQIFKIPIDKISKEMRRQAKTINFGILYGMGVNALRQSLGGTRTEAQKFYQTYFDTFTELAEYLERIKKETAEKGYTETYYGRKRYFKGMDSKLPYIRAAAERMAINAPIQGTEADIIKIAMKRADDYLEKENLGKRVYMLLQVHDALLFEMEGELVEEVIPKIRSLMEEVIPKEDIEGIVLKVDASVGENWNEMESFKYSPSGQAPR